MPFSNYFLLCYALFGSLTPAFAQQHEFGVVAGISGYVGELARRNTLFNSGARANDRFIAFDNGGISAFYKYRFNREQQSFLKRRAGLRANLSYMRIGAEHTSLIFSSNVYEFAVLYERDIYRVKIARRHFLDFYILGGVGVNAYAMRQREVVDPDNPDQVITEPIQNFSADRDLSNERFGLSIPLGGGIKWRPQGDNGPWSVGIEALGRMTTDRLDGIYPRFPTTNPGGDPVPNNFFFDIYKMLGIRVSYTLFDCDCPQW